MADKILVDYEVNVNSLQAQLKAVNDEFAKTEQAGKDAGKETEESFKGTEKAAESLKTQLRKLQAQLAEATDPKDIERLAKAAGGLRDKINDATEAARIFASDSKFEQVGNAIKSIGGNLLSLNFKQAADQSKLLVAASKSITFKEALGGLKDLGTTLLNVGKSLLSNPLFLLGAAITTIITNFDKLKNAGGAIGTFFTGIGDIIGWVTDKITDIGDAIGITDSKANALADNQKKNAQATLAFLSDVSVAIEKNNILIRQNLGLLTAEEAKRLVLSKQFLADYTAELKKQNAEIAKARKEANLDRITESADEKIQLLADEKRFQSTEAAIKAQHAETLKGIQSKYQSDVEVINSEAVKLQREADKKAADDRAKAAKEAAEKLAKAYNEGLAKMWKSAEDDIDKNVKDTVNANNEKIKSNDSYWKSAEKDIDENVKDTIDANNKKIASDKATQEEQGKIIEAGTALALKSLDAISTVNARKTEERLFQVQEESEQELKVLQNQLDKRLISQEQFDKKKAQLESTVRKKEAEIKRKQFENDRAIAIIEAVINTAVAVTKNLKIPAVAALVAAAGAIEIALIASQPTPKFEKGGKVKGARHTDGGVLIEAEKDEWIINRNQSLKHDKLLDSINKGVAEKYINEVYIAPVLRQTVRIVAEQKEKDFAKNIANSFMLQQQFNDKNIVESLKKSRKNDQEIAYYLVKNLNPKVNKYNW